MVLSSKLERHLRHGFPRVVGALSSACNLGGLMQEKIPRNKEEKNYKNSNPEMKRYREESAHLFFNSTGNQVREMLKS